MRLFGSLASALVSTVAEVLSLALSPVVASGERLHTP